MIILLVKLILFMYYIIPLEQSKLLPNFDRYRVDAKSMIYCIKYHNWVRFLILNFLLYLYTLQFHLVSWLICWMNSGPWLSKDIEKCISTTLSSSSFHFRMCQCSAQEVQAPWVDARCGTVVKELFYLMWTVLTGSLSVWRMGIPLIRHSMKIRRMNGSWGWWLLK